MNKYLVTILSSSLILAACQPGSDSSSPAPASAPIEAAPALQSADFKPAETHVDKGTGLVITTQEVTDSSLQKLKQEADLTTLSPFPVAPQFNAQLFTFDQKEYKDFVFLTPKIYAFSTTDGARISILENSDGTVSIPFHVTMVSGLENKVPGPKTTDLVVLPESYLVKKSEDLKNEVFSRGRSKIAMLPGCPKAFSLKVVDREFDVTPKDLGVSDYCDLSKPFTLALRTSKSTAQYILQKALYDNTVDLRADYQTMVPYVISKVEVSFNKQRIYDELEIHFKANYKGLASVDARYYLEKIMKSQVMSVDIRGNYDQQLQLAVDNAMKIFFVEVPEVKKVELDCAGTIACVTFNRDYRSYEQNLSFTFERTASTLGSRIFRSTTRLQPLNDRSIIIGDGSAEVADQALRRPSLYNDGSSIETGLTVQDGDLIEISPSYLNIEERELDKSKVTKSSNNVCVETRIEKQCRRVNSPCVLRGAPAEAAACPKEIICTEEVVCARTEDQYVQTTEYSSGLSTMKKVDRPVGQFKEIYEGLVLKFTAASYEGDKTRDVEMTCPLKYFQREGSGDRLVVRLENQPGCEIFKKGKQNLPMLHIVNGIQFPRKYKTGADRINWRGDVLQRHSESTFSPKIGFGGTIRIYGYRIHSQNVN